MCELANLCKTMLLYHHHLKNNFNQWQWWKNCVDLSKSNSNAVGCVQTALYKSLRLPFGSFWKISSLVWFWVLIMHLHMISFKIPPSGETICSVKRIRFRRRVWSSIVNTTSALCLGTLEFRILRKMRHGNILNRNLHICYSSCKLCVIFFSVSKNSMALNIANNFHFPSIYWFMLLNTLKREKLGKLWKK